MRTNLIQSYLNNPNQNLPQNDRVSKEFDIHKELSNRTFIKPLPSNGKLVRTNLSNIITETWKDIEYDAKAFRHALKGEANDHELGCLNDVGMKFGGFAIASYLFTQKKTPKTKLFEFIGLGTFFFAMDVWPKLFLQLPAYLIHGVDIRQKYEDSFGRKKMFYLDNQFIPWDLYSDKEINKIGNRLGVPKDIPNRREYIQEKMRKIALQNNTLWMLTAGFATPILSALMCNMLEKPTLKYLDERSNAQADALMNNLQEEIKKYDSSANKKELERIISENTGKPVTPDVFESIFKNLSKDIDAVTASSIRTDLERLLPGGKNKLSEDSVNNIYKVLKEHFSNGVLTDEEIKRIVPDAEAIQNAFTAGKQMDAGMKEFSEPLKIIEDLVDERVAGLLGEDTKSVKARQLNMLKRTIGSAFATEDSPLQTAFKTTPATILTEDTAKVLKEVSETLNDVKAKCSVFDRFVFMKAAQAQETVLANSWNEISESLMKSLNFTPAEIRLGKFDREAAGEILRNKLETLAADKEGFAKFIDEFRHLMSDFDGKMSALLNDKGDEAHVYHKKVNSTFDDSAKSLRQKGLQKTADSLAGYNDSAETSLKGVYRTFLTDRVNGVKYSFYRLLDTASFYYRIAQGDRLDEILPPQMYREAKEEAVELAKVTLLEGHTSDTAVKLFQNRYLYPDRNDRSQIEVVNGKVKNKYFGNRQAKDMVEFANDNEYFEKVMKMMFGGELPAEISDRIKNAGFYEDFMQYRRDVLKYIGNDEYFAKLFHKVRINPDQHHVNNVPLEHAPSSYKFNLWGCTPDEMFYKLFNNKYNNKMWFSMVKKISAVLIGATILAQFFIGKTKDPEKIQQEAVK